MLAAAVAALPACTRSASSDGKAEPSNPPQVASNPVSPARPIAPPAPPAATIAPAAGANAGATPASSPSAATPTSTPAAATVVPFAAPTGPRIVSVLATPSIVHNGDTVHWDVRTSPDVVAVSAKVATYGFDLQRSGPGHFTLGFAIPKSVPFFFHRTYTLDVVARDGAGATANTTIALSFQ